MVKLGETGPWVCPSGKLLVLPKEMSRPWLDRQTARKAENITGNVAGGGGGRGREGGGREEGASVGTGAV